jgi:hypothetical protein
MPSQINISNASIVGTNAIGDSSVAYSSGRQTASATSNHAALDELVRELRKRGVGQPDLAELASAIAADESAPELAAKRFGPRVTAWLNTMISKAANASWQLEIGVAGSLLAAAIQRYYGWP